VIADIKQQLMQVWVLWSFVGYRPKEELLADGAIHKQSIGFNNSFIHGQALRKH
jgi:hypothetical protein